MQNAIIFKKENLWAERHETEWKRWLLLLLLLLLEWMLAGIGIVVGRKSPNRKEGVAIGVFIRVGDENECCASPLPTKNQKYIRRL